MELGRGTRRNVTCHYKAFLIRRRFEIHVIDNDRINGHFRRLEFEAELLFDSSKE